MTKPQHSIPQWEYLILAGRGFQYFSEGVGSKLGIGTRSAVIAWVGPPPTNSGILGIYKDPNTITVTTCGHY